jgi:hypothetical protein
MRVQDIGLPKRQNHPGSPGKPQGQPHPGRAFAVRRDHPDRRDPGTVP